MVWVSKGTDCSSTLVRVEIDAASTVVRRSYRAGGRPSSAGLHQGDVSARQQDKNNSQQVVDMRVSAALESDQLDWLMKKCNSTVSRGLTRSIRLLFPLSFHAHCFQPKLRSRPRLSLATGQRARLCLDAPRNPIIQLRTTRVCPSRLIEFINPLSVLALPFTIPLQSTFYT